MLTGELRHQVEVAPPSLPLCPLAGRPWRRFKARNNLPGVFRSLR